MTHSSIARYFLALNSAFSAVNGIALVFAANLISPLLFADPAQWATVGLRILGIGLLGFAALLFFLSRNKYVSKSAVNEIVILDIAWVLGSIAILAMLSQLLTPAGIAIVSVVALIVAVFATGQFVGAKKIAKPLSTANVNMREGKLVATVNRRVNATTDAVWQVMTDHPGYADVASNITKVDVLSGEGLGMKRRCFGPKGENWEETCNLYEEGKAYGFRIHTEAADYPYPISDLTGVWSVKALPKGSEFLIEIAARPKGNAASRFMFTHIAKVQFKTVLIELAEAWSKKMEQAPLARK